MYNPESVLENETHKLLNEFEMQMNNLISARRPDRIIIVIMKKRTCRIVDFAVPADSWVKLKEGKGIEKKKIGIKVKETSLPYYLPIVPIYQPLRSGRIWHKVNF